MTKTQIISIIIIAVVLISGVYFWRTNPMEYFGQTGSVNQSVDQKTNETDVSTSSIPFDLDGKG